MVLLVVVVIAVEEVVRVVVIVAVVLTSSSSSSISISSSSNSLRELALAYRRKYRMSCEHARVGSFGAITRVCHIGGEGRFPHHGSPPSTEPQLQWFSLALVDGGTPHFCLNATKERIGKVQKTSPTEKLILGTLLSFFKDNVRSGVA